MAVTERSRARVIYRQPDQRASRAAGPGVAPTRLSLLLLALVLFSGGLVIGRGSARSSSAESPATPPASTAPAAQSKPATSEVPAAVPVRASAAGPARAVAGVGVGWAHSQAGAVAAATNYALVLGGELLFDQARRHQAIAVLAAPKARAALQREADEAARLTRKGLRLPDGAAGAAQAVVLTAPLGARVDHYDGSSARVAIWTTGMAGSTTGIPVSQASGVTVIDLEWVGGDWRQVRVSSRPAPTAMAASDEVPSTASEFLKQTQQFKEYDYAPRP